MLRFAITLTIVLAPAVVRSQEPEAVAPSNGEATDASMEQQAAEYRALLAQPAEKLADLCRKRGVKLLADLKYGRALAKGEAREKNLESSRAELLAQATETKKQHEALRDRLQAEMAQIRQQFADDSTECDRRLFALVNMHRPEAVALRDEIQRLEALATQKDLQLSPLRSELATLAQERDSLAEGNQFRRPETPLDLLAGTGDGNDAGIDSSPLEELGLDAVRLGLAGLGSNGLVLQSTAKPVTTDQVQQAVDDFDSLFR